MIRAIILDDGYHERAVVINDGINYTKKSLSSFVEELCLSHLADYQVKTASFENLSQPFKLSFDELYDNFDKYSSQTVFYFTSLWNSKELIDGVILY